MSKYDNVCLIQDILPRVVNETTGYIQDDQGIATAHLYLDYALGKPDSVSYYFDLMVGWNQVNNICIHDTRDLEADDTVVGMDLYRKKLGRIRAHVKHSMVLCGRDGAVSYDRRVASIAERSTALLQYHQDTRGRCTWAMSDCRNKVHYSRTTGEKLLPFLEGMVRVLNNAIREFDDYRQYVRKDIQLIANKDSHT